MTEDMAGEIGAIVVGDAAYTRAETAAAAGVEVDSAVALWRAMGFAEVRDGDRVFSERDVRALRTASLLRELGVVDEAGLLALTRTMAQALSRLAHSHASIAASYLGGLAAPLDPLADEAVHTAAETLLDDVASLLEYVWRRHLAVAAESAFTAAPAASVETAVGFADLVGFTETSRSMTPEELSALVETFEHLAAHLVGDVGGRVVKTLGDEVLFVADDVHGAVRLGLDLAERTPEATGVEVRVGVAFGPVVPRLGDVFGPTVNIASRLTALARPGTVLLDRGAASALRDDAAFEVSPLRRQSVRGYSHLAPFRVRRAVTS
ncbi:MAG TPA: adenylate/guanylate cyclase domain-containing protein [Frankiaceae bacterium]|nr:adenylate/guanylate cyclase domain-containing protein [Frankiaceae bacterium]